MKVRGILIVNQKKILISASIPADEDLIKYAWPQDVWFHVDKLSSAHVYLRMPEDMSWEAIPQALLVDCAQLVKANSIEGECRGIRFMGSRSCVGGSG